MATKKPKPSFDPGVPSAPSATGWVYRTEPASVAARPTPTVTNPLAPVAVPSVAPPVVRPAPTPVTQRRYVPASLRTLLLPLALIAVCAERR